MLRFPTRVGMSLATAFQRQSQIKHGNSRRYATETILPGMTNPPQVGEARKKGAKQLSVQKGRPTRCVELVQREERASR